MNTFPIEHIEADRAAMLPLPPVPLRMCWRYRIRLGLEYYVHVDTDDYSVEPHAVGRRVDISTDLDQVRVRAAGC